MKRIGVLTSGGDSPGMNAAIRAVVRCGIDKGLEVYGIQRGYEGLIDGEIEEMDRNSVGDIMQRGGTMLKTARSERFRTEEGVDRAIAMLDTFGIEGLVVIGGDGTLHGAADLTRKGIKVMGLPGTIDNDLGYTDFTIGFDTAVTTVLEAISKIRDTSSSHERTTVIEVMGRRCGDIALFAGLAGGAEDILVPELPYDVTALCKKIVMSANRGKQHSIIIKAEGVDITTQELVDEIEKRTGRETKMVILSYLQRGGSPTMRDRILATLCGSKAVDLLKEDSESKAIGTEDGAIVSFDLLEALEQTRELDMEMYDLIGVLSK
ncbi:6-phosphofructokinase [Aminicella lysinilytica]|uniref:ATP-dependent 6-phosphofructokinase n=1 Tax=Aminicella lysinilytica TaxID=433323 RepID=A0A4R6Q6S4_9FIRM|nr:6-phosphofructokinase [Aminicella lysinilytica]TDP57901.1 6-phosphofructokinase [Aminicella lysinilytica]